MSEEPATHGPTPANYQRTTGGHLRWQPPTPEHLQTLLPAYEILSIIGKGGMGAVYQGRQKSLDRLVAIKLLPPEAADNDMEFVARFKNEARTMAKMNHPAIVHVYDFGETLDGQLYIVMEYIDGTDVAKMLQSQGKLPPEHALAISAHVCDALQYAHTHGVVHRDIKPANILLNMEGQIKVADFGLAKTTDTSQAGLTKTNMAMGTPDFVAPETLTPGMNVDGRADLYAVGVMLYNMLTGQVPRGAFRMPSVTSATDMRFDKIIGQCMEMDPAMRYQTAFDVRRDLDVILTTPLAKPGVRTISVKPRDLPQKPVGKSPSTPQQQRPPGSAGVPVRTSQPPPSGPAAKPAPPPAKTGQRAQAPAAPPQKSKAGMIYGIAAVVAVVAAAVAFLLSSGKKPTAQTASKPRENTTTKPASTALHSGTFTLEAADGKPSGGARPDEKAVVIYDWGTGSNLEWSQDQVDAGTYQITLSAGGFRPRDHEMRLEIGSQSLSFHLRSDTGSGYKTSDYPVGLITLPSRARGIRLRCLNEGKVEKEKYQENTFHLRAVKFTATKPAAPALAASPTAAYKPNAVLTFAGHRYQLVPEKLKWDAAKAKAESMGGHLATITTKEENDWVWGSIMSKLKKTAADPTGDRCFIGAIQRKAPDGPWEWITGEPFSLQTWMGRFPDDKNNSGKVATLQSKSWDDVAQSYEALSFLVEWDDAAPAKPAPLALTSPVNLLAYVDVKRDAVYGEWTLSEEGLLLKQAAGMKLLGFHEDLPDEYDFEIEFTPAKGEREVIQVLPVSGGTALHWRMGVNKNDPTLFAFGPVLDGKNPEDPKRTEAVVKHPRLQADLRYRSTVEVRKGSLRALLDGKEVLKWSGDFKRFPMEKSAALKLRDPLQAGVGGHDSGIIFHKAELRPPSAAPSVAEVVKPAEPAPKTPPMPAAESAQPADPRLAQLEAGYQTHYDSDAQKPFLAAVAALNQSYAANGISRARAAAQSKGSLAEVNALDAEKTAIESGGGVPVEDAADAPESIKTLRSTYRTVLARLTAERDAKAAPLLQLYLGALDVYVADLTKADKIDEARKVQALRDAKAQQATSPPVEIAQQSTATGNGFTNSLGMKFVPVKGTDILFCIHETRRQDYAAFAADTPSLDGAWKTANRNGVPVGDKDDHPVVSVSWDHAHQFCAWLSKKEGKTYRLPTDEEWSMAVGIGHQENRRKDSTPGSLRFGVKDEYPWGGHFPPKTKDKAGNYHDISCAEKFKTTPKLVESKLEDYDDGFATTAPVMSFKPNKLGLYDLGGNVDEWVEDWYETSQKEHTTRGMNWISAGGNMHQETLSSFRGHYAPDKHENTTGFRVVLEVPKSAAQ